MMNRLAPWMLIAAVLVAAAALKLHDSATASRESAADGRGDGGLGDGGLGDGATAAGRSAEQAIGPTAPGFDTEGDALIRRAARRLQQWDAISAKVRHRTRLFDQKLVGAGRYQQARGPDRPLVRFSLNVRADSTTSWGLLHVCDGNFLWLRDDLDETTRLRRVDLRRVEQEAEKLRVVPEHLDPLLSGGGLLSLMTALETHFHFSRPQRLTYQGIPMWALAGHWRSEALRSLLQPTEPSTTTNASTEAPIALPKQMPDRVFLLIGRDDLFPYHVDFRRGTLDEATTASLKDLRRDSDSLVTMELFEVQFDQPADPLAFRYQPGDVQVAFQTEIYLERIRQFARGRLRGKPQRP